MAVKTTSGSNIVLSIDAAGGSSHAIIAGATSCTFNYNQETIDSSSKDSGGRKEFINGATSWTMDCEAFYNVIDAGGSATTNSADALMAALKAGTKISCEWKDGSGQTGAKTYTGDGYITSVSKGASVGEFATYSISIQGTGELTVA